MSRGYVYILSNPSMPGIIKIGKTTRDPDSRAHELYQTGVPTPFKVEHYLESPDCNALESILHRYYRDSRISDSREFFLKCPHEAYEALERALIDQINCWLDDFLPDHEVVQADTIVDQAHISMLSQAIGEHSFCVASAMGYLTAEEMRPAMGRWKAVLQERAAKREQSKVVAING